MSVGRIRWLMYEQSSASFSRTLLVVMILWLVLVFISFGLFAPQRDRNHQPLCCRIGGFWRDFLDLGDVHAFQRTYTDLKCSSPLRPRTSRPVGKERATLGSPTPL